MLIKRKPRVTIIHLPTLINAPIERCFDLSRSIDLHQSSMDQTNEKAIAGRITGLIELGETVTWQASHFLLRQKLSSKITEMDRPNYFVDEMVKGAFKSLRHTHSFQSQKEGERILMIDEFCYEVPFGFLGSAFNVVILNRYMTALLKSRNEHIKSVAESTPWKKFLIQ